MNGRRTVGRSNRPERTPVDPAARSRLVWGLTGAAFIVLSCVAAGYALSVTLEPAARQLSYQYETRLVWVDRPRWLTSPAWQDVLAEIERHVDLRSDDDIYHPELCSYVARAVAASAWIERVHRASKLNDGRIEIRASFRRPFAMSVRDATAYLLDATGVRLPRDVPVADVNAAEWILIRGARSRLPAIGQRWEGDDLAAGMRLAAYLYEAAAAGKVPFRNQLRAIDVSNFGRRLDPRAGQLRLDTVFPQTYIHWGLPPGEEYDIEATAEQKLKNLREKLAPTGALSDLGAIDVRDPHEIRWIEPTGRGRG
jgi:hypothetical protein